MGGKSLGVLGYFVWSAGFFVFSRAGACGVLHRC